MSNTTSNFPLNSRVSFEAEDESGKMYTGYGTVIGTPESDEHVYPGEVLVKFDAEPVHPSDATSEVLGTDSLTLVPNATTSPAPLANGAHWADSNEASFEHLRNLRAANGLDSVNFRLCPKFQAGDVALWGANRHRVLAVEAVTPLGIYYQVQAIEGTCAFHKPVQASEDCLRPVTPANLIRAGVVCGTCADEGETSCNCNADLQS